ncbi:MAG: PEP-CTERM sorting domain-containing protein [Tepidisphaerales bacterium]
MGRNLGSSGTVVVSGLNSVWDNQDGYLVAGFSGRGAVTVSDQGLVLSTGGFVGRNPGSSGSVVVQGTGSEWRSPLGDISVGLGPNSSTGGTGVLTVSSGGTVTTSMLRLGSTGTLTGNGQIAGPVQNGGTVSPGISTGTQAASGSYSPLATAPPGNSPQTLVINGSYTQLTNGVLNIELGGHTAGTDYDVLQVSGTASLDGILQVSLINGFVPGASDVFQILTAGARQGQFRVVNSTGTTFNTIYTASGVSISPVSVVVQAPKVVLDVPLGDGTTDGQTKSLDLGTLMKGSVVLSGIPVKDIGNLAATAPDLAYTAVGTGMTVTGPSTIGIGANASASLTTSTLNAAYGANLSGTVTIADGTSVNEIVMITGKVADAPQPGVPVNSSAVTPGQSYAGLSSKVTGGLGSEAVILAGSNGGATAKPVTEQWTLRTHDEASGNVPFGGNLGPKPKIISEVLDLTGTDSNLIVLQMSYSQDGFVNAQAELDAAMNGWIQIVSWDSTNSKWVPTVDLNSTPGGSLQLPLGPWNGDLTLGHFGVDIDANIAWAVIDHNSRFAVVPEPSMLGILALSTLSLITRRHRRVA